MNGYGSKDQGEEINPDELTYTPFEQSKFFSTREMSDNEDELIDEYH